MDPKIDKEYATEAPNNDFDKDEIEESILSEKKKQGKITKLVAKPYKQRSIARSQFQSISQMVSGVNKPADVNVEELKMDEKMFQFKKQAEKIAYTKRNGSNVFLVDDSVRIC